MRFIFLAIIPKNFFGKVNIFLTKKRKKVNNNEIFWEIKKPDISLKGVPLGSKKFQLTFFRKRVLFLLS